MAIITIENAVAALERLKKRFAATPLTTTKKKKTKKMSTSTLAMKAHLLYALENLIVTIKKTTNKIVAIKMIKNMKIVTINVVSAGYSLAGNPFKKGSQMTT